MPQEASATRNPGSQLGAAFRMVMEWISRMTVLVDCRARLWMLEAHWPIACSSNFVGQARYAARQSVEFVSWTSPVVAG